MTRKNRSHVSTNRLIKLFEKYEGNVYEIKKHVTGLSYTGIRLRLIKAGLIGYSGAKPKDLVR